MKKEDLKTHLKIITPSLEKFTFSLLPLKEQALDLISDAYSVYLVKNADDLMQRDLADLNSMDLSFFRKELLGGILKEIYQLALRNSGQYNEDLRSHQSFQSYYALDMRMRAYLYLEFQMNYADNDLLSFFNLKRHELIELKFNAKKLLLRNYQQIDNVSGAQL